MRVLDQSIQADRLSPSSALRDEGTKLSTPPSDEIAYDETALNHGKKLERLAQTHSNKKLATNTFYRKRSKVKRSAANWCTSGGHEASAIMAGQFRKE